jgi:hypothetical protein
MTGGTIRGNAVKSPVAAFSGGGVYLHTVAAFSKTGGLIYGANAGADSNEVWNGANRIDSRGHAIIQGSKYRDTTVSGNLSSSDSTW